MTPARAPAAAPVPPPARRARGGPISRWAAFVRWYLREVSGEGDYQRYLDSFEHLHGCGRPLNRAEFERRRMAAREETATHRCC